MLMDRTALTSLKKDFVTLCLRDQDCFKTERQWETLLSLLPGDRGRPLNHVVEEYTDNRNNRKPTRQVAS
jgi:hypothetical protein